MAEDKDKVRNRKPADDGADAGPDDIPVSRLAAKFGWEAGDVEVSRPGEKPPVRKPAG
jgi:hypothetical protein